MFGKLRPLHFSILSFFSLLPLRRLVLSANKDLWLQRQLKRFRRKEIKKNQIEINSNENCRMFFICVGKERNGSSCEIKPVFHCRGIKPE